MKERIAADLDRVAPNKKDTDLPLDKEEFREFWKTDRTMFASCGFHSAAVACGFVNIQQKVVSYPSLDRSASRDLSGRGY